MSATRAAWLALGLTACVAAPAACPEPEDALSAARAYVGDACVRRTAMERSVAAADTPYADLRLAHYALSGAGVNDPANDWDALPVFTRPVRRFRVDGASASEDALEAGPVLDEAPSDLASYEAAGARAFERFPIQIDLGLARLRDRATAERAGFFVTSEGLVDGVVEVETATGWTPSLTCIACHARREGETLLVGVPNERIDLGLLFGHSDWPVGTMDVTDDGVTNPIRPSDLRPIAMQVRLQHTGNLFNGRVARMVRIETLMIGQLSSAFRPDREIPAAIALFLEAEGERLPRPDRSAEGAALFDRSCSECHRGEEHAGPPVSVDLVGTDPMATTGGQRGTGSYRAPSLLGVGDRRGVFHDGSAADLREVLFLTPSARTSHPFASSLTTEERDAIARYLTR